MYWRRIHVSPRNHMKFQCFMVLGNRAALAPGGLEGGDMLREAIYVSHFNHLQRHAGERRQSKPGQGAAANGMRVSGHQAMETGDLTFAPTTALPSLAEHSHPALTSLAFAPAPPSIPACSFRARSVR